MYDVVKVIAFDADDTLWVNEPIFRAAEAQFFTLLEGFDVEHRIAKELYKTEMDNLSKFGYGIKGFTLSMIETALQVSGNKVSSQAIQQIIDLGKSMMDEDVEILPDVEQVLQNLKSHYRLIMVTKGDLSDQERKLKKSGLAGHFHHIEIVSEKKEENYKSLLKHLDIIEKDFLMVGNSLKSDILPVINIGAAAIHIPYHVTWEHEHIHEQELVGKEYKTLKRISELPGLLETKF